MRWMWHCGLQPTGCLNSVRFNAADGSREVDILKSTDEPLVRKRYIFKMQSRVTFLQGFLSSTQMKFGIVNTDVHELQQLMRSDFHVSDKVSQKLLAGGLTWTGTGVSVPTPESRDTDPDFLLQFYIRAAAYIKSETYKMLDKSVIWYHAHTSYPFLVPNF